MDRRLGPLDKIRLNLAIGQSHDLDTTRVVAAVPLHIDIAGLIGALTERGRILGAVVRGDHTNRPQLRLVAGILQEERAPSCRHDNGLAEKADIAGTDKVVAPCDAVPAVLEPFLTAPAIAVELHDLLDKVPGPDRLA